MHSHIGDPSCLDGSVWGNPSLSEGDRSTLVAYLRSHVSRRWLDCFVAKVVVCLVESQLYVCGFLIKHEWVLGQDFSKLLPQSHNLALEPLMAFAPASRHWTDRESFGIKAELPWLNSAFELSWVVYGFVSLVWGLFGVTVWTLGILALLKL